MLAAADVNSDTRTDLVVGMDDSTYQVATKDAGDPNYTLLPAVALAGLPGGMALVDLDGDNHKDLIVAAGSVLEVARGIGDGTFGNPTMTQIDPSPEGLAIGDFDRDGRADVAVTSSSMDHVTILEGLGNGSFRDAVRIQLAVGAGTWAIAAGDLDGDTHDDLVVTYSSVSQIAVLLDTCTP